MKTSQHSIIHSPFGLHLMPLLIMPILVHGCTAFKDGERLKIDQKQSEKRYAINQVPNATYDEECSSCHISYLAGFLPSRSWTKIMNNLSHHFGENASLDDTVRDRILQYLQTNSADSAGASSKSKKLSAMISPADSPIRITETPFWKRKHGSIKSYVWNRPKVQSRAKCDSCHDGAGKGNFDEHTARIPK